MSTYDKLVGATAQGELPPAVLAGIEASVAEYTPTASRATVDYWISPTGDDDAEGSNTAPWRTIARAVASIPDVIRAGHTHTINLAPGDWNEQLAVQNKTILGLLTVRGSTSDRYAHTIRDAYTINVQGHYLIENIHSSKTTPGVSFRYAASGPRMELDNVSGTGEVTDEPHSSGNQGVLADYGSSVTVENSKFDYKDYAIRSNYGSNVVSRNNAGTGNTHGIGARFGGRVEIHGTIPHGYESTTTFSSGGTIVHETGGHVGVQRYSQALDKSDTFGLVQQVTLQGQGSITPIKQWVSRGATTRQGEMGAGGGDIPAGSTLRFYFQMTTSTEAPVVIDVTATWVAVGSTARRFVKALIVPSIRAASVAAGTGAPQILASNVGGGGVDENHLTVTHSGADSIFHLDFTPNGGSPNGQYGLDIQMSNPRHADAPIMLGAEVLAL